MSPRWGMNPGMLNRRIQIQAVTRTSDDQGGWTEGWATSATVWARREPLTAREEVEGAARDSSSTHQYTIRAGQTVTAAHRIVDDIGTLEVTAPPVNMDERDGFVAFEAKLDADPTPAELS